MKKYIDFLLEDTAVQDDTKDATVKEASTVDFDTLKKKLDDLWKIVFTTRMLNFSQDRPDQLQAKIDNTEKYGKYKPEMEQIMQKKNASVDKRTQANDAALKKIATTQKITAVITALTTLGVKVIRAKQIVTPISAKNPDITEKELCYRAVRELGSVATDPANTCQTCKDEIVTTK